MKRLTIFDDGNKIATITTVDDIVWIFARSSREWNDVNRWVKADYFRLESSTDQYIKITPLDNNFLEYVAARAHEYDFSTELIDD